MPTISLRPELLSPLYERLQQANATHATRYPGESDRRQPLHTVYGGAHLFQPDTAPKLGALALRSLEDFGSTPASFADAIGLAVDRELAQRIYERIVEKLRREPVEDFRIDFEDGFGNRPDDEEDEHAERAAAALARGLADGTLPPFTGIRIKPFTDELHERSMRTLDIFLSTLCRQEGLPPNFVVTLPKVTHSEQVAALVDLLDALEAALGLPFGSLKLELMVETTQAIFDEDGNAPLPRLVQAARGRCLAAHFGTYDYTAACNITAAHQHMAHPACDFAKHVMQVTLAGTGVWLSDGATNILPVAPHRTTAGGRLTDAQRAENLAAVHGAWRLHYSHVRHSLIHAFYQGWDLHPAQLPTRYAAVYAFFLEGLLPAADRLRNFVEKAAQATLVGEVFDDAATGQGLLNFFLRALNSGAITEEEATVLSGLTMEELRGRSFVRILNARKSRT